MTRLSRGDIVLVNLDPSVGTEANKTRPCVIVGNPSITAAASRHGIGVITVVPLTRSVSRVWPSQVVISSDESGLPSDSKAQSEQIRAVDVRRVVRTLGSLSAQTMAELDEALRFHLSL